MRTYANNPMTMLGIPFMTSAAKRVIRLICVWGYSDRNVPPSTPIGIPKHPASPINVNVPVMALAIPPPGSPAAPGSLVKKSQFRADSPVWARNARTKARGVSTRTVQSKHTRVIP
jgi:hypothetical protein